MLDGVDLEEKKLQFLYADDVLHLMEPESFEESVLPTNIVEGREFFYILFFKTFYMNSFVILQHFYFFGSGVSNHPSTL